MTLPCAFAVAAALACAAMPATAGSAGINYGRSPIPRETLNPLLPLITERHVAVGYGRRLSTEWEFSTGLEWDLSACQRYTNPNLPFGTNAEECIGAVVWRFMWSRRWQ